MVSYGAKRDLDRVLAFLDAESAPQEPLVWESGSDLHDDAQLSLVFDEPANDRVAAHPRPFPRDIAAPLRGFLFADFAALFLAFPAAWALALAANAMFYGRYDLYDSAQDVFVQIAGSLLIGCGVMVWFAHSGHYRMRLPFWMETKRIIEAVACAMLIDIFSRFIVKQDFSRLWLVSGWALFALGSIGLRAALRAYRIRSNAWAVPTLLVGFGETADEVRNALRSEPALGFDLVEQIADLPAAFGQAGCSWQKMCAERRADFVMLALEGMDLLKCKRILAQLSREEVPFSIALPLHSIPVIGMEPQYFFNHNVLLLTHNHGLNLGLPRLTKRLFDIVVASLALAVLMPLLVAIASLVKRDGGPVFFRHKRLGLNGVSFSCLKFRSMVVDGDATLMKLLDEDSEARNEWERDHKLRDDPRVTRLGAFIRKWSLDELPQLINVVKGDMSLVGPRPIIVAETEKYDSDIRHYYRVRPGITGLWQVSGRNDVSYAERVRMDSWYVRNWCLWHDIAIICKTIPAVFRKSGAY